MFRNFASLYGEDWLPHRQIQPGGPPLVCCPRLHIQYIPSYTPYWWSFRIRKLRTRHEVVRETHTPNIVRVMRWAGHVTRMGGEQRCTQGSGGET
jgi:hypothetical protein